MPLNTDIRQAIVLAIEAQGTQGLDQLRGALEVVNAQIEEFAGAFREGTASVTTHASAVARLVQVQGDLRDAIVAARSAEGEAMRARIDAAAREERVQQQSVAFRDKLNANLIEFDRLEAEAHRASVEQQIADEARLQAALGGMEKRRHDEAAEEAYQQQLRDEAALQEYLGRKTQEAAQAEVAAVQTSIAARVRGTQAVRDEVAEIEKARVAAIAAMGDRAQGYAREERALEALQAQLARNAQLRDKEAAAEAWMTRQTNELAAAMDGLAESEKSAQTYSFFADSGRHAIGKTTEEVLALGSAMTRSAQTSQVASGGIVGFIDRLNPFNTAAKAAAKSSTDLSHANDAMMRSTRNAGYGFLSFAHAIQDAQYGTAAVLNNIPLMVAGIGGSAGMAGAVMIAGVAFETLKPQLSTFGRSIGALRDPLKDATDSVSGLQEKIQAISDKPFKVAADYRTLKELNEQLRVTKKAMDEWEALKNRDTKAVKAAKEVMQEGIAEGGGARNLEDAIIDIKKRDKTFGADSELHGQIAWSKDEEKALNVLIKTTGGENSSNPITQGFVLRRDFVRAEITRLNNAIDDEARAKIADLVGMIHGKLPIGEGARKTLEDLLLDPKNKDILAAHGVTNKAALGVVMASPENMAAEKDRAASDKAQADAVKKADKEAKEAAGKRDKAIDEAVAATKGGSDDQLQVDLFHDIQGRRLDPEAAAAGRKGALVAGLRTRKVPEEIVGDVADRLLKQARDSALNLIAEGGKPKLDVKAEAEFNKAVGAVDQGFTDRAAAMFVRNEIGIAQGLPVARNRRQEREFQAVGQNYSVPTEEMSARVEHFVGNDLRRTGNDPALAPEIRRRAGELVKVRATEAMARTPMPDPTAMADAVGNRNAEAMAQQAQATSVLIQVLGTLDAKMNQIAQQTQRNLAGVNGVQAQMQQNANRMKARRLTRLPFFAPNH